MKKGKPILRVITRRCEKVFFWVFLLTVFIPPLYCPAATIEPIYVDSAGEGFKDTAPLGEEEKELLGRHGNNAETYGEARRNAFEYAAGLLGSRIADGNTVKVEVAFDIFDSNNQECPELKGPVTVAVAGPTDYIYFSSRLDLTSEPGLGTAYNVALGEALTGEDFYPGEPDIQVRFNKCLESRFYYGFTQPSSEEKRIDFVQIAMHEIIHGLGFSTDIKGNGELKERGISEIEDDGEEKIKIRSQSIYDVQLYSEGYDDLLINLSSSERAEAIASETELSWDGTDEGRNECGYGQLAAKQKSPSAKSPDGKPLIHAPSTFALGGSIVHVDLATKDVMGPYVGPRNMDLALAMLKDVGWNIKEDALPDCSSSGPRPAPPLDPQPEPPPDPQPEPPSDPQPEPPPDPQPEPPPEPQPPTDTEEEGGGCALVSGPAGEHVSAGAAFNLFLILSALLLPAIPGKIRPSEK